MVQKATVVEKLSKVITLSGQKGTLGSVRSGPAYHAIMRGVDLAMVIGLMLPHLKSLLLIRAVIFYKKFCHEDNKSIYGRSIVYFA